MRGPLRVIIGWLGLQDRFGKPPEAVRSKSDDNEGLSFTWLPAALRGGQSLVEEDEQGGKAYFPLMGSLQPEAEVPSSDQLVCAEVRAFTTFALSWMPSTTISHFVECSLTFSNCVS